MARLDGRVAIVTGGASGIGRATAQTFVAEGARVLIADIDDAAGEALADELGKACIYQHTDHTVRAENEAAVARAVEAFGGLDILHNNAGAPFHGRFAQVDDQEYARVIAINLDGPFRMTQAALSALREGAKAREGGAAILFTSSIQGISARPNVSAYTAAKHGVVGLMRSLALELAGYAIRVNAICPVTTDSPMLRQFMPKEWTDEEFQAAREAARRQIPLGRIAMPEDIAAAALFLASDEARMITGVALAVDGGITVGPASLSKP